MQAFVPFGFPFVKCYPKIQLRTLCHDGLQLAGIVIPKLIYICRVTTFPKESVL